MLEAYSPETRMTAYTGGPLRSVSNYQYGFYDIGPIRDILENDDLDSNDVQVAALPIPSNNREYEIVEAIAKHPRIQYAIVDKDKIMFVRVGKKTGWFSAFAEQGFLLRGGSKTPKRGKQLHRPTSLNAKFNIDELNVMVVEDTRFTDYDFSTPNEEVPSWMQDPAVVERLLDGAFAVSTRVLEKAIANIPNYNPNNSTDPEEYYYDDRLRNEMINDFRSVRGYNARIIGPIGMIKGNCFICDLPEGIDVITSNANIKKELSNSRAFYFLAEPQWPKPYANTDIQTVINNPKLFRKSDMEYWLREEYKKIFRDITDGKILADYKRIYKRLWHEGDKIDDQELHARMTYVGYRWVAMGLSVTNSPWLFQTLALSHAKPLQKRIPIPCAIYEQVIPESIARMCGWDGTVQQSTIRRCMNLGVHIVNDLDWLEMYESHGGHDADDFFKLFYREIEGGEMNGEKVIFAIRCPNGYGEYSVFKYVDGEPYPEWEDSEGIKISFPKVNGRSWPMRLSESIRKGVVRYTGLPSENNPKNIQYSEHYSVDDFLMNVKNTMTSGNVGGYVNSVMLHSLTLAKHRPYQVCSLEAAIDGCTQTDDPEDRVAIDREADIIVREVIASGKQIDKFYWESRGFAYRYRDHDVELFNGKVTQMADLCVKYYQQYAQKVVEWAQENARPVEMVGKLGERLVLHAQADIRRFRREIFESNMNPDSFTGSINRDTWEMLYEKIANHIDNFDRIEDQHDYVIALLHSSIKFPTTGGVVTDQIVMNKTIYPYLERAFIFYGIGSLLKLEVDNKGRQRVIDIVVDQWQHTDPEGNVTVFDNAIDYQQHHQLYSEIRHTAPPIASVTSDLRPLNIK